MSAFDSGVVSPDITSPYCSRVISSSTRLPCALSIKSRALAVTLAAVSNAASATFGATSIPLATPAPPAPAAAPPKNPTKAASPNRSCASSLVKVGSRSALFKEDMPS